MTVFRAAVVQAASVAFDRDRTLERVRSLTAEAADRGARLIVFPEAFVSGYPAGPRLRRPGRLANARGPRAVPPLLGERRRRARARPPTALGASARDAGAHLVIGVIERDGGHALLLGPVLRPRRHACWASTAS